MPRFYAYNVAIKKRLRRNGLVGAYPPDAENLAMCYDGTRRDVGEPVDPFVENALYSAYTGTHCLGYLTISTPDGLIIFVDGPFEGHHNDITMANLSGINAKIRDPQGFFCKLDSTSPFLNNFFFSLTIFLFIYLSHSPLILDR